MECSICQLSATLMCSRCFEAYCSLQCQITDWPKHKLECKPVPPLVEMNTVFQDPSKMKNAVSGFAKKYQYNDTFVKERSPIKQTTPVGQHNRITGPNDVTVQAPKSEAGSRKSSIAEPSKQQKHEVNKNMNKGFNNEVHAQNSTKVEVPRHQVPNADNKAPAKSQYVEDRKREETLRASKREENFQTRKREETVQTGKREENIQARKREESVRTNNIECKQQNTNNEEPRRESSTHPLPAEQPKSTTKKEAPQNIVNKTEVKHSNAAINDNIEKLPKKFFSIDDLETIKLREGENIPVIITDISFFDNLVIAIAMADQDQSAKLAENLARLSDYCAKAEKEMKGYKPKLNEMCLAIFDEDEQWYRAFCQEESLDGSLIVQFVDYGNVAEVTPENVMPMTEEMMFPAYTHMCRVKNVKKDQVKAVKKYIANKRTIKVDIRLNKNDEFYDIDIMDLHKMVE